jgi:undecaprenyl-diphosphatase
MYRYNKKIGVYFLVAAALVGLSRVYVGVHYPFDILGGILLALVTVFIMERISWDKIILKK